jgi:Predicted AAA-ATPase/PD-(D/E)XK nuclease superfamily
MKRRVVYAEANYEALVRKHGYFVDKTEYIAKLELVENPVFLRPRRFGKSLLCSMLSYYYDLDYAHRFEELFGHTWIGQHPTGQQSQFMVLSLDFSTIVVGPTITDIEESFKRQCNYTISALRDRYQSLLADLPDVDLDAPVVDNLNRLLTYIWARKLPPIYVIIDEYDNFANQLITGLKDQLYRQLTADDSFLKTFFKMLKEGRKTGAITNVFITGVLPIVMDELASGFNVATFITLDAEFEAMLGFTETEVTHLLNTVYEEHNFDPGTRKEIDTIIKNQYNGYYFVTTDGETLYNSTMLMYFLNEFTRHRKIPDFLADMNLRTDLSWVQRLTGAINVWDTANTNTFLEQLTTQNRINYDRTFLTTKFNTRQFFEPSFFPISFFYLGMLTLEDRFYLRLPNLNMRQIFVEYFNELNRIDVSTRYGEMMQRFVNQPNLEELFAGYWREYVSQLPEAIFQKMNENFYRTTFYELCSRYLSPWFTWNVERSYPSGKSDLEFVGKYHEQFAGLRWIIEFKYYSNSEFKKFNTTIDAFELQAEDAHQIAGYTETLRLEDPEAQIAQFVIYCIGNQGFRVFAL